MAVQTGIPIATAYAPGGATTVIKPTNGVLFGISVTGGTGAVSIYDNTAGSGNLIYNNSATVTVGLVILFNAPFSVGLTIVTGASTTVAVMFS